MQGWIVHGIGNLFVTFKKWGVWEGMCIFTPVPIIVSDDDDDSNIKELIAPHNGRISSTPVKVCMYLHM